MLQIYLQIYLQIHLNYAELLILWSFLVVQLLLCKINLKQELNAVGVAKLQRTIRPTAAPSLLCHGSKSVLKLHIKNIETRDLFCFRAPLL